MSLGVIVNQISQLSGSYGAVAHLAHLVFKVWGCLKTPPQLLEGMAFSGCLKAISKKSPCFRTNEALPVPTSHGALPCQFLSDYRLRWQLRATCGGKYQWLPLHKEWCHGPCSLNSHCSLCVTVINVHPSLPCWAVDFSLSPCLSPLCPLIELGDES